MSGKVANSSKIQEYQFLDLNEKNEDQPVIELICFSI